MHRLPHNLPSLTLLIAFVTLVSSARDAAAFNPDDYPPSTISAVVKKVSSQIEVATNHSKEKQYSFVGDIAFRATAKIKGAVRKNLRPFVGVGREMLRMWGKSTNRDLVKLYQQELQIGDSDGKMYWVPIQETLVPDLEKECPAKDCSVALFLVYVARRADDKDLILVNEFKVAGAEESPLGDFAATKKTCDGGEPKACTTLGAMYLHGQGVKQDVKTAIALWSKSCDKGERFACSNLGQLYVVGMGGVPRDPAKGIPYLSKSCAAKNPVACTYLGGALASGDGVKRDVKRAVELLSAACAEFGDACYTLGRLYYEGVGIKLDKQRGLSLLRQGCSKGAEESCELLEKLGASPKP